MGESEEPFVIARKLLRRRHVRKEQHRKEKEAQEALYARELCNNRKRKGQSDRSGTRHPSMVLSVTPATSDSTTIYFTSAIANALEGRLVFRHESYVITTGKWFLQHQSSLEH